MVLLRLDQSIYLIAQPQACSFVQRANTATGVSITPVAVSRLLEAVRDPTSAEVVWRKLDDYLVARQDANVVHPHLP